MPKADHVPATSGKLRNEHSDGEAYGCALSTSIWQMCSCRQEQTQISRQDALKLPKPDRRRDASLSRRFRQPKPPACCRPCRPPACSLARCSPAPGPIQQKTSRPWPCAILRRTRAAPHRGCRAAQRKTTRVPRCTRTSQPANNNLRDGCSRVTQRQSTEETQGRRAFRAMCEKCKETRRVQNERCIDETGSKQ